MEDLPNDQPIEAGTIAHDFISKNGEGDKLANLIYRDQEKAKEAARTIGEVAKIKSAYFGSQQLFILDLLSNPKD